MTKKSKSKTQSLDLTEILKGIIEAIKIMSDEINEKLEFINEKLDKLESINDDIVELYNHNREFCDFMAKKLSDIQAVLSDIDRDVVGFRKMVWVQYNSGKTYSKTYSKRRSYRR